MRSSFAALSGSAARRLSSTSSSTRVYTVLETSSGWQRLALQYDAPANRSRQPAPERQRCSCTVEVSRDVASRTEGLLVHPEDRSRIRQTRSPRWQPLALSG